MQRVFTARIQNKTLVFENKNLLGQYLNSLKEGDVLDVKIQIHRNDRTNNQNSYYWVILGVIAEDTGHTANELHEIFKRKFLPPKFATYRGEEIELPSTTTTLNTEEMAKYMEQIIIEAGLLGINIPPPTQVG